ncbi:MAG: adenosine kinase [Paraprevotella sp.]|nr:adenosine kinase [Paraprevotella sp.]
MQYLCKKIIEMGKIIGVGNALVDVLAPVTEGELEALGLERGSMQLIDEERYRTLGDRLSAVRTERATGGSAANTILALAALGQEAGFMGKVGRDELGRFFADTFNRQGVRLHLTESPLHTGVASTFVSKDGERTFATFLGAAATMCAEDVRPEELDDYDVLYVEGYLVQNHELIQTVMRKAHEAGLKVALDMASYNVVEAERDFFAYLLSRYVDIVLANEEEARAFTGKEPEEALVEFSALCHTAVVKLGARGAMACCGDCCVTVASEPVERVVDTTAAGDFFAGGFLYGELRNCPLADCVRLGNLMGRRAVRVWGTALTPEEWHEIRLKVKDIVG